MQDVKVEQDSQAKLVVEEKRPSYEEIPGFRGLLARATQMLRKKCLEYADVSFFTVSRAWAPGMAVEGE